MTVGKQDTYDEHLLLQRTADGDMAAFRVIFNTYWDKIYSTALMFTKSSDLSEDLAQDVFAKIWEKRETLTGIDKLGGYLFVTARNMVFDKMKKKVLTVENESYLKEYFQDPDSLPHDQYEMKELNAIIQKGISQLPLQQQTAFRLSRFQGMSHEEIAAEMGIARQTVKSHISRAIITLRKTLEMYSDKLPVLIWISIFL